MKPMLNSCMKWAGVATAVLMTLVMLSCGLLATTPSDEEILRAVVSSNKAEVKPPNLVYDGMKVPHRFPGHASAVLWTPDKRIQRNYSVSYDKEKGAFYVETYSTQVLGEDGVYRDGD